MYLLLMRLIVISIKEYDLYKKSLDYICNIGMLFAMGVKKINETRVFTSKTLKLNKNNI
tara:strand:+ start:245 stop:421 length:177 start_codon:yes stop_codon:yes gene_type:complete